MLWVVLEQGRGEADCAEGLLNLLSIVQILLCIRCVRLFGIIIFFVVFGPVLLCCYFKNRPKPPVNPKSLIKNFTKVTVDELRELRSLGYRHTPTPRAAS